MTLDNPTQTQEQSARQIRAGQILNSATELIERFGYKRVTIDDIATQTRIARGTIYQFWKTREALFNAVLVREFSAVIEEMLAAVRQDPTQALLHRLMRIEFLEVMRHPILHALFTADLTMLGKLAEDGIFRALDAHQDVIFRDYIVLLVEHGLLRSDIPVDKLYYALNATATGFFLAEPFSSEQYRFDAESQADLLATTIRSAFEVKGSPEAVQAIALRVIALFDEILDDYQSQLRLADD